MIIYKLGKRQNSLKKEPYVSFDQQYKALAGNLHNAEIELPICSGEEGAFSSICFDASNMGSRDVVLKFEFVKIPPENMTGYCIANATTFIKAEISFEYDMENEVSFFINSLKEIVEKEEYYYIPNTEYLEVEYKINDRIHCSINSLVLDDDDVLEVCHCLINQFISLFANGY